MISIFGTSNFYFLLPVISIFVSEGKVLNKKNNSAPKRQIFTSTCNLVKDNRCTNQFCPEVAVT